MTHVVVIVLGDIGRSPRMQYHAYSLSQLDYISKVTLVGYGGEMVISSLRNNSKVKIEALELEKLRAFEVKSSIIRAILKGSYLIFWLVYILFFGLSRYQLVLIQNPPALPAFFVAIVASLCNGSRVVLDWHNLGYSIYEHGLKSKSHPLVQITKFCEHHICRFASHHICVSQALQTYLKHNCGIDAIVVYDRPPSIFQAVKSSSKTSTKKKNSAVVPFLESLGVSSIPQPIKSAKLPALIVSGTSWTADEDFSILLDALVSIEKQLSEGYEVHDALICVVTGKGELRAFYEQSISQLYHDKKLGRFVSVHTAWLAMEDYPRLLANADLGISLHESTSGLDLPMKVLDMFGTGLPVVALDFPTLHELVLNDQNGLVFTSSEDLSTHLFYLLFSQNGTKSIKKYQDYLKTFDRWDSNWSKTFEPLVKKILS